MLLFPNLQSLELQNVGITLPPDFFPWSNASLTLPLNLSRTEYLQNLYASTLYLDLPYNEPRRLFNLRYNSITNISDFTFYGPIHMITLENNQITKIEPKLISQVTGLQNLDFSTNYIEDIPNGFLRGHVSLRSLSFRNNRLQQLAPDTFKDQAKLIILDLSYNKLTELTTGLFTPLLSLKRVNLESNNIHKIDAGTFPIISKRLEHIILDNNPLTELPVSVFYISSLTKTSIKNSHITFQNFTGLLKSIHANLLSQNVLAYDPDKKAARVREIDLTGGRVVNFATKPEKLEETDKRKLILLLKYFTFILKDNPLRCDCNIASFSTFVNNLTVQNTLSSDSYIYHDWKCVWPPEFKGFDMFYVDPRDTYCSCCSDEPNYCPPNCTCFVRFGREVVIVDCRNSSYLSLPERMPKSGLLDLWFENNNISTVSNEVYFDRVRQLRLVNNNIQTFDGSGMKHLSSMKELWLNSNHISYVPQNIIERNLSSVKFQDNPFNCDCHNMWFKHWIIKNKAIIEDWEEITCGSESETGSRLVDASDDKFVCQTAMDFTVHIAATASCTVALIVAITFIAVYKFEIQVLLYLWFGIHPFDCMKEKGAENIDVIIIHNLDITDWINDHILRFLESTCRLRVCAIDRDFVAGYSFRENISFMAAQSKRMLIVLSPSVLSSEDLVSMAVSESHQKVRDSRVNFFIFVCHQISRTEVCNKQIRKEMRRSRVISSSSKLFMEKLLYLMPRKRNIEDLKVHIELESLTISFTRQNTMTTIFDILILYGENYQIVFRELVPKLESTGYILCLPDREFVPGSAKQANILTAIKSSRHTLIVLTEENMNDEWLVFGFRSAMEKNIQDKSNHLVVLTDNKINPDDLHTEMRHYVQSHVILYLDDSCLWEKMHRSMPLKTRCRW